MLYCTFRHFAEYLFVNEGLDAIRHLPEYAEMKNALWHHGGEPGVWPHIKNEALETYMMSIGQVKQSRCGDAQLLCIEAQPFVAHCLRAMETVDERFLWDLKICYPETLEWLRKLKQLKGK